MSLQLEQDAKVPIQTHIDEFSSRFAIMIFLWIVVTIFWITNIDIVLEKIIHAGKGYSELRLSNERPRDSMIGNERL